jgi:nitroreductase
MKRLSKTLPSWMRNLLRRAAISTNLASIRVFSANPSLARFYYFFINRSFRSENFSVINGRAAFYRSVQELRKTSSLLRRNVHRLEKGLVMRPRRLVFAEDYIIETVQIYKRAMIRSGYSEEELRWARDVLDEYFSVVKDTPTILKARFEYLDSLERSPIKEGAVSFKPYSLSSCPKVTIEFDQLLDLFAQRRSVRWYRKNPVPQEFIQQVINAAALAPSACNRQPYRFVVANEPELARRIAECAGGTVGFAHQIPAIIVVIGDLSAFPKERDRHLIYLDAAFASMQLMLAAQVLGLATCPINWPDVDSADKKLNKILGLPSYERVIMLVSIGFGNPDGEVPFSQKKRDSLITEYLAAV